MVNRLLIKMQAAYIADLVPVKTKKMKNSLKRTTLVLLVIFLAISCNDSKKQKQNSEITDIKVQSVDAVQKLCFKNVFVFQDMPSMKDVEELTLTIEGEKITGTYNWLPAEKDQRKGNLTGTIKDNLIEARYTYVQEGTEEGVALKIYIDANEATIKGGAPELGLDASIKKIDCD